MGEIVGEKVGPYRLVRRLGKGGFGEVFEAVHEHLDRRSALKLLLPEAAQHPQIGPRFLQEGRVLEQLRHPGIVRVWNCGIENGRAYLEMEYLEGIDLRRWLREQDCSVTLQTALAIGRQIADAMVAVHAKGIVHRDIKPENIFLASDPAVPSGHQIKVIDFGVAKAPPSEDEARIDTQIATAASPPLGTPMYMAPEQWLNTASVTDRADVYALGAVLFEMIAGRPLFVADGPFELMMKHREEAPPLLQELVPTATAGLCVLLSSMLAKDPLQRPAMLRVWAELGRPREGEPDECPFPGLQPFSDAQAELFFGRQTEAGEILARLEQTRAGEPRWVQIEGQSGVGKTSLVQAGVLPRLEEVRAADGPLWRVARLRPSEDPLRTLAQALFSVCKGLDREAIERSLRDDDELALADFARACTPAGCFLLLVVEQMEELFTLGAVSCPRFDALVAAALTAPASPVRLLSTVRSDFVHRLDLAPNLARLLNKASRYLLRPMEEKALTQVIEGMVQRAGLRLEEGLAARMVRDAASADSCLPLLGHTLRGLWSPEVGSLLTLERYRALGGVSGALARHARLLLDGLGAEGRERAKWLILDLVQVGHGVPDTRRPRTKEEVLAAAGEDAERVLMHLAGKDVSRSDSVEHNLRLIVLSDEPAADAGSARVDLVHEMLLTEEPTIAGWLNEEHKLLERLADLESTAQAWERAGCPTNEGLPSGSLLEHYRGHTEENRQPERLQRMASDLARRFLQEATRLERRQNRNKRVVQVILALGAAMILLFAIVAWWEQKRAEENLQKTISEMDQIISDVDWKLSRIPATLQVREEMLRDIDVRLTSLLRQEPDKPEVRKMFIAAKHRRSDLAREDGTLADASRFLNEASEELERSEVRWSADPDLLELQALNDSKRGKVEQARDQRSDAESHFDKALRSLKPAYGDSDSPNGVRTLATSYFEPAELQLEQGHAAEAALLDELALELLDRLVRMKDDDPAYNQSLLASALQLRAEAARKTDDLPTAVERIEEALGYAEFVVQSHSGNAFYRWTLASILVEHAAIQAEQEQLAAAAEGYGKALEIGCALTSGDPTRKAYALVLVQSLQGDEALARRQGARDRAEGDRIERCALVAMLMQRDAADARFQRLSCP